MTVIKPNSVAGINSITVQSGEALSVHKSDGTLIRTITSSSGVSTFTSASVGAATTDNNADASINVGLGASISQHATNSLSLGTGGNERLRITSGGLIGVNNNTPLYALHFKNAMGSTPSFIHMEATGSNTVGGGGGIAFDTSASSSDSNNSLYLATIKGIRNSSDYGSNDLVFSNTTNAVTGDDDAGNETEYARIDTTAIDVSNGSETGYINFHTRALSSFNPILSLQGRSSASAPSVGSDATNGLIVDVYNGGNPYPRYVNLIAKGGGDTDSNLTFWTEAVGGAPTEKVRIEAGGDVDIKSGVIKLASGANRRLIYRSGNNDLLLEADSGDFYRQDIANSTHEFFTGNTERLSITSGGIVQIGGDLSNGTGDLDTTNSKLSIKQSANNQEDGIYIERSGERRGFYAYVGGALSQSDAFGIASQQLGTKTDVLAIDRGGDIAVGAGDIFFSTAGKGIVLGATSNTSANTL